MTIEIGLMISIISVLLAIATFLIGRTTAAKEEGKKNGSITTKLDGLVDSVDGIKISVDNLSAQIGDQRDRLTRLETRVDMYHNHSNEKG